MNTSDRAAEFSKVNAERFRGPVSVSDFADLKRHLDLLSFQSGSTANPKSQCQRGLLDESGVFECALPADIGSYTPTMLSQY